MIKIKMIEDFVRHFNLYIFLAICCYEGKIVVSCSFIHIFRLFQDIRFKYFNLYYIHAYIFIIRKFLFRYFNSLVFPFIFGTWINIEIQ